MPSAYHKIMELPLFKGLSKEQISFFLEKTPVGFRNFIPGETIIPQGQEIKEVEMVFSGEVFFHWNFNNQVLSFSERAGFGKTLFTDRLFGLSRTAPCAVTAATECSIIHFSKEQFITLLRNNPICLINFLNYLSARAQRPVSYLESPGNPCNEPLKNFARHILSDSSSISFQK